MTKGLYKLISGFLSKKHIHLIKGLNYLGRETAISLDRYDYVRLATLELLSREIEENSVAGNVAELGVYKGDFAKYINEVFKNRTLYLFDTFSGFNDTDIEKEKGKGLEYKAQNFADTSESIVSNKMPYQKSCVIRKGYFPETFTGLENESFAFVSIDADLYEPILNGLNIFYPRLSTGGYIMVHDYNNIHYAGCKKAVNEFCRSHGLSFVPIPDSGGSVVIGK